MNINMNSCQKVKKSKSCEICMVRAVQNKMEEILLGLPNITEEVEREAVSKFLFLLKSKSEEMIVFYQVLLKVKNELAYAQLDLERAKKNTEVVNFSYQDEEKRVKWLEERLNLLNENCQQFYKDADKEINDKAIEIRRSSISPSLYNLFSSKTQNSINESCSCSKSEGRHKSKEEKALGKLSKDVNLVLEKVENKSSYLIPSHQKPSLNEKRSSVSSVVGGSISFSRKEDKRGSSVTLPNVSVASCDDQETEEGYWHSEHHRHEWYNFQQLIHPLSWHDLSIAKCDSFIKKENPATTVPTLLRGCSYGEIEQPISSVLPLIEVPNPNSLAGYNKAALDRLVNRLQNLYTSIEDAALATVDLKTDDSKLSLKQNSSNKLPDINGNESLVAIQEKNSNFISGQGIVSVEGAPKENKKKKKKEVYPRNPSIWCDQQLPAADLFVTSMQQSKPVMTKSETSHRAITEKEVKRSAEEKRSAIKRAAVRVKAVAKIKRHFGFGKEDDDYVDIKNNRIQDLLGRNGLLSDNKNIAVDAAKALGQLNYHNKEIVIKALINMLSQEKETRLAYECARSLLLLGSWNTAAVEVVTHFLITGNIGIQCDLLEVIRKSPNAAFVSKSNKEVMELSNVLVDQVNHPSGTLAFDAAICIGQLCIYNEDAKCILLNSLDESTYTKIADALWALIKQMNCKDDVVIDKLLHQISHSSAWQHRMQAAELLRFIGKRRLQTYGMDKVYDVLLELLWNHPNKEFRKEVASLITEFDLRSEACAYTFRQLMDKNESARAAAVIALSTLKMKGDKELKILMDILDLDSSAYVRTQVIRAFKNLEWNDQRIIRTLKERQKGDDVLAEEAGKALTTLQNLS